MQSFCSVCVENAIGKGLELIAASVNSDTSGDTMMTYACRRVFTESSGYCTLSARVDAPDCNTHSDKCREHATGARSHLCSIPLGPALGLIAPQHGSGDIARMFGVGIEVGHAGYGCYR